MKPPGREEVEASRAEVLSGGSTVKARVLVVRSGGAPVVVKDVARATPLWRPVLRLLLRMEERVLRRLEGVAGVPRLLGRVDRNAIAMTRLEGRPLSHESARDAAPEFFERLERLVEAIHARGVVHLDLRQKRNVLVGPDGLPRVVDFGGALCPPSLLAPPLRAIDWTAAVKFRLKYRPATVGAEEAERHRRFERIRRLWFFSRMRRRRPGRA